MDLGVSVLLCLLAFVSGYLLGHHYGMINAMEINAFGNQVDKSKSPRPTQDK